MFYMDRMARNESLEDVYLDEDVYRNEILEDILFYSESMDEICLYCTHGRFCNINSYRTCKICQRWAHVVCILKKVNTLGKDPLHTKEICFLCDF